MNGVFQMTLTPIIGLVADRKDVTTGPWIDVPNDAINHSYVTAISAAGGSPVLIPSTDVNLANVDRLLDAIDGLLLPGGADLDPELYGQLPHAENDPPLRIRDDLEIALTRRAVELGVPVYGVCRGMQVLNVALGGTLEQHLDDRLDMTPHRNVVGTFTSHLVQPVAGTRLARAVGTKELTITSHHHQAVQHLGRGLIPSAAAPDGVIEAVEVAGSQFVLGVQWHPEENLPGGGSALFEAFIRAAASFGAQRGAQSVA